MRRIAYLILTVILIVQVVRYMATVGDPMPHLQASVDACICLMVFLSVSDSRAKQ